MFLNEKKKHNMSKFLCFAYRQKSHKQILNMGRGSDGQVVSMLAFYAKDQCRDTTRYVVCRWTEQNKNILLCHMSVFVDPDTFKAFTFVNFNILKCTEIIPCIK